MLGLPAVEPDTCQQWSETFTKFPWCRQDPVVEAFRRQPGCNVANNGCYQRERVLVQTQPVHVIKLTAPEHPLATSGGIAAALPQFPQNSIQPPMPSKLL